MGGEQDKEGEGAVLRVTNKWSVRALAQWENHRSSVVFRKERRWDLKMIAKTIGAKANRWGKVSTVHFEGVDLLLPLLNSCSERDGVEFQVRKREGQGSCTHSCCALKEMNARHDGAHI